MRLPQPVPELPVDDVRRSAEAYAGQMGFNVDWTHEEYLAGISRDSARVFLRRRTPEETKAGYTVTIWLNMSSPAEVDELYAFWSSRGVAMARDLHTASYNLRQFTAQDLDGNKLRVFYDLGGAGA